MLHLVGLMIFRSVSNLSFFTFMASSILKGPSFVQAYSTSLPNARSRVPNGLAANIFCKAITCFFSSLPITGAFTGSIADLFRRAVDLADFIAGVEDNDEVDLKGSNNEESSEIFYSSGCFNIVFPFSGTGVCRFLESAGFFTTSPFLTSSSFEMPTFFPAFFASSAAFLASSTLVRSALKQACSKRSLTHTCDLHFRQLIV